MDIEVIHDPLSLPIKRLYRVAGSEQAAKRSLDAFIDSKVERGYRLRVIPFKGKRLLELSSRRSMNVDMGLRALRDAGFQPKRVPYANHNTILKQLSGRKD